MKDLFIDNSILIVPSSVRKKILLSLSKSKKMYNIKFMSLNEFITSLNFAYDEKAIVYIVNKYNVSYNVANTYLNNLKYIEDKEYDSAKLNFLLNLKNELKEKSLLIYNDLFLNYIKNKTIKIYGYSKIDKFSMRLLKKYNVNFIYEENNYIHKVYEFNTIFDEIEFVFEKICELINNKVNINDIKIANYNDEYSAVLRLMSDFYNININFKINDSIYSSFIVSDFLKNLGKDINVTLNYLKNKYNLENEDNLFIFNSIIKILNKYYFIDNYLEIKDILIEELKSVKKQEKIYENAVEIININDNALDSEYVFLIGFNQGLIPRIYKDEDYLSDKDKNELFIDDSKSLNILEKNSVLNFIKNTKNLFITYKNKSYFSSYFKSSLIDELGYEIIVDYPLKRVYSNKNNKLNLYKDLDNYIKYNESSDRFNVLSSNYLVNYKSFNNSYKPIKKENLYKHINNKLTLSYTSMNDYYKCSFKYYLKHILKIDKYEETIDTIIGNLFHHILSICFNDNFDFEKEFNLFTLKYDLNSKDKFYILKLKEDLKLIIKTIKNQYVNMSFNKALYEEEFIINYNKNIKITFKGFIDKILYKEKNDKTYLIIIDYKTGSDIAEINNSIYGINMQLPVYLYLAKNSTKLKNVEVLGFYLQKLLDSPKRSTSKTITEVKKDNLKLQGYSISDESLLSYIDEDYENSQIIKSLKKGKEGFYKYSKVLTKENINNLYTLTENKINEAINNISDAKFDINPKKIGDKLVGCEYCKFKDICFRENENIINLKKQKSIDFLGGEENA